MKKFFLIFLFLILNSGIVLADDYYVKYDKDYYQLKISEKSPEHNGYYNQYYKYNENQDNWSEMIAVHHFPNVYSPVEQAYNFKEFLKSNKCPSSLQIDNVHNSGMLDFVLIDGEQLPIVLDFNAFKYEKSKDCGTIAFQYAKRFEVYNLNELENTKKNFEKFRPKALKKIKKYTIPDIINKDIQNNTQ